MTVVLIACALIVGVPLVLALGARLQGRDVLQEVLRTVYEVPALIRDGAARICREAWSRFQETLELSGIRDDWVQQSVAALLFAPAALISILALAINVIASLADTYNTTIPLIEALTNAGVGPAVLTGLEMILACLLFPALVLDLMGITNISHYYSPDNIPKKWLRFGLMAFFALGTVAAGYILFESGLMRGAGLEGAGSNADLVQASGLESGGSSPDRGAETQRTGPSQWTVQSLMTLPSLLGFIAGALSLVFVFPAATLLVATPLLLVVIAPTGLVWGITHLIVHVVNAVYNLMLSIFNFVLHLRGAEPVEGPGGSNLPDDSGAPENQGGTFGNNGRGDSSSESSARNSSDGTGPVRRDPGSTGTERSANGQPENGRADDPAGDAAETDPLYDDDDENWNPIA